MSNSYDNAATSGRNDEYTSGQGTESLTGHHHHGNHQQHQSSGPSSGQGYENQSSGIGHSSESTSGQGYESQSELRGSDLQPEGARTGADYSSSHTGGIPAVHEGHVSAGSQLVAGEQGFTGVDMAAETAKFDNAFGAVPGSISPMAGGQTSTSTTGGAHRSTGEGQYDSASDSQYGSTGHGQHGSTTGLSQHGSTTGHSHSLHESTTGNSQHGSTSGQTGFQQSSGGAYQGSTEHQHSSHGHHQGSSNSHSDGSYTGNKSEQREQMKEEKKEAAAEKKEELKERNASGESKTQIAKDEHRKVAEEADEETPDGKKPGLMDKIKTAVKKL